MAGELERRIARLQPGDHLCLIYGSPAERWATLIPFFRQALAAGARCLCIADAESHGDCERALAEAGMTLEGEPGRGSLLIVEARDLLAGRFEPHAMIDLLRQAEQQ